MRRVMRTGIMGEDFQEHRPAKFGNTKLEDFARIFATVYNGCWQRARAGITPSARPGRGRTISHPPPHLVMKGLPSAIASSFPSTITFPFMTTWRLQK